ncbi:MAG: hypothetical protein J1F12_07405 [Muribaculaceae bacterium]|nr:hypothetical protein [Muribaculaceae bacterium]
MKLKLIICFSLILGLTGCSGNRKSENGMEPEKTKSLVLFYSQTGATKEVAEEIQKQTGADIDSIVPVESYGYDYDATIQRWLKEKEDSVKVAIKPLTRNINDYDTIYLGYPIWGGTYASPVATFIEDNSLEGKTVITFASFGSGGIETSTSEVAKNVAKANVIEGYGVRNALIAKSPAEIQRWLIEKGYKKGEIEKLPEYGPMEPVTPEEQEIFNQACGDYKFPLGTPMEVSKRSYDDINDYKYEVTSVSPDGKESHSIIYVSKIGNEKPEFTRVVR